MAFNLDNDLIKGKISSIISEQLPEFVQSDHPTFITFLDAYYEFLEQHGEAVEVTRNSRIYNDIDLTVDAFVDYFKKNFLVRQLLSFQSSTDEGCGRISRSV